MTMFVRMSDSVCMEQHDNTHARSPPASLDSRSGWRTSGERAPCGLEGGYSTDLFLGRPVRQIVLDRPRSVAIAAEVLRDHCTQRGAQAFPVGK